MKRTTLTFGRSFNRHCNERTGGILMLMAALLPVLFILGSLAINVAYIQLTRTELMVATDSAARGGGRAMSYYQNVDSAIDAAVATAALNKVGGKALRLSDADTDNEIEFGDCDFGEENDRYQFEKMETSSVRNGNNMAIAVRVTGKLTEDSLTGRLTTLFPTYGRTNKFELRSQAVAMQVDRDIGLILDRSGSMAWVTYDWPSGFSPWDYSSLDAGVAGGILGYNAYQGYYYYTSGNDQTSYFDYLHEDHLGLGPVQSPWDELVHAVDVFLQVLENTDQDEQVSLASYATSATLDIELVTDYELIRDELNSLNADGATAIGYGMQTGIPTLLDVTKARPFAAKTLIVMTDGMHNTGTTPQDAAQQIVANYDVTIHTVTFGPDADQDAMQEVAEMGAGKHYHAQTGQELIEVFEEIANNLPTIITQ